MKNQLVTLTWMEQMFAAYVGSLRRIKAINERLSEPYSTPKGDLWGNDIESSGAEMAVAKALGLYWTAARGIDAAGDVSGLEVRSTKYPTGRLIVHKADKDDAPFVLVRGVFPTYEIVGWITGRDAKAEAYWFAGDGRPAYFVPEEDLADLDELKACGAVQPLELLVSCRRAVQESKEVPNGS